MRVAAVIPALLMLLACGGGEDADQAALPTFQESLIELSGLNEIAPREPEGRYMGAIKIALDAERHPIVAWGSHFITDDLITRDQICVARWDGETWREIGGGSFGEAGITGLPEAPARSDTVGRFLSVDLATGPDGLPSVSWGNSGASQELNLLRWNGEQWFTPSPLSPEETSVAIRAVWHSFAVDAEGRVIISMTDQSKTDVPPSIRVIRENAEGWEMLGDPLSDLGLTPQGFGAMVHTEIAVDPSGHPVLVLSAGGHRQQNRLLVAWWDGTRWMGLDDPLLPTRSGFAIDHSLDTHIAFHGDESLHVAWTEGFTQRAGRSITGGSEVKLRQWDGHHWSSLGRSASPEGLSDRLDDPSFLQSLDLDRMAVNSSMTARVVATAADAAGNPIIVWSESHSGTDILYFAERWNGQEWVEVWKGSSGLPGLSVEGGYIFDAMIDDQGVMHFVTRDFDFNSKSEFEVHVYQAAIPNWVTAATTAGAASE